MQDNKEQQPIYGTIPTQQCTPLYSMGGSPSIYPTFVGPQQVHQNPADGPVLVPVILPGPSVTLAPSAGGYPQPLPTPTTESATPTPSRWKVWSVTGVSVIAVVTNALLMFIWLLADHGFPWFIYPLFGTVAVATACYVLVYSKERRLLTLHLLLSANINLMLIFTYIFAFTQYPWFVNVLFPSLSLFSIHYLIEQYRDPESTSSKGQLLFNIHLYSIYLPLNVMLFISFVASEPDQPWFLYPLLITSIPVAMHYILLYRADDPHKWFLVHASVNALMNMFFFMVWYTAGHGFPWFVFILAVSVLLLALHYGLQFHRGRLQTHLDHIEKVSVTTLSNLQQKGAAVVNDWQQQQGAPTTLSEREKGVEV